MPKEKPKKTREQRVMDAVEIMKNLRMIGITDQDPGYLETKKVLDEFIQTGESWSGKIQFPRQGRYAQVILTGREGFKNTFVLKVRTE